MPEAYRHESLCTRDCDKSQSFAHTEWQEQCAQENSCCNGDADDTMHRRTRYMKCRQRTLHRGGVGDENQSEKNEHCRTLGVGGSACNGKADAVFEQLHEPQALHAG